MSSVLTTRRLFSGSQGSHYQSDNEVRLTTKGKVQAVTFPKIIGATLREGEYCNLEYKVNELTKEVFLVFYKKPTDDSIPIDLDDNGTQKTTRKLTIRNKWMCEYICQDLDIVATEVTLNISKNLSKNPDYVTYKITKR